MTHLTTRKRDSFLFGHPSGIYFQSRVTFFLHFYWLMTERVQPCECVPCARQAKGGQPRKRKSFDLLDKSLPIGC